MRFFLASVFWLFFAATTTRAQLSLPETLTVKQGRLARIEAKCDTPVRWINVHDELDLIPDSSGRWTVVMSSTPGTYKIAAYTATKDGTPSDPAYCKIVVNGSDVTPPRPGPPPAPKNNVEAAIVRLRFGNSGCTATIIGPRRGDGRWDVLTAAHCTGPVGSRGTMTIADGRSFPVTVQVRNVTADISWMIADVKDATMAYALLAEKNPAPGTPVWHKGFGIDKPGNKEEGTVAAAEDLNGQLRLTLSVSSGDSGSGIFRADSNALVAVVCCTSSMAKKGSMWGGSAQRAAQMRPSGMAMEPAFDEELPLEIPLREQIAKLMPFAWIP